MSLLLFVTNFDIIYKLLFIHVQLMYIIEGCMYKNYSYNTHQWMTNKVKIINALDINIKVGIGNKTIYLSSHVDN